MLGGAILAGLCLLFPALIGRLVYINTTLSPRLTAFVQAQQNGRTPVAARRGFVLDAAGRVVAGTRLRPSVYADPALIEELAPTAARLAPILDMSADDIEKLLRARRTQRFCWLRRLIDPADAKAVRALEIRGIGVVQEPKRSYPMGTLMAQTVGIVGREGLGLEGLEKVYDDHLRGEDGEAATIHGGRSGRRPIWLRDDLCRPPRDGGHVVLTLDSVIQELLERELAEAVEEFQAECGVGVVMAPQTGAVLALGQYPTFDPNHYADAPSDRRRNRAICDALEPGSTFKPYVACGALLAGVVSGDEVIFCHNGQYRFGNRLMHDSSPRGHLTFREIISKSSNIGMGIVGERMGNRDIHNIVRAFGFGTPTEVRFPGEATGLVRPLSRWNSYSTTSVPIGQEVAVTPLQLATAFSSIVNGGMLLRPRLVKALLNSDGSVVESFEEPVVVRRVIPQALANYVTREFLVAVINHGGGWRAKLDAWQVAGKTGTAQVAYPDRPGYEPNAYTGSFIGAAPAARPEIVVLVMIHKPSAALGYYGGKVAAPAAARVLAGTLAYLEIPPDNPAEFN